MPRFVERHPFLLFSLLATVIPIVLVGALLVFPQFFERLYGGPVDIGQALTRAAEEAGVEYGVGSNFLPSLIRLCLVEPLLWLLVLGGAAPTLAGIVMMGVTSGRAGFRTWLGRFRPWLNGVGARSALRTYVTLIVVLVLAELAIYGVRYALGGSIRDAYTFRVQPLTMGFLTGFVLSAFLDQGSALEEPGWRGYALFLLQGRMRSPLAASAILGLAWSLWHLPRDVGFGIIDSLGIVQYLFLYLPAFTANCILVSILAAYFSNRTGGSVLPAIMVHGLSNDAVGLSGSSAGMTLTPVHQLTILLPFLVTVIALLMREGSALGVSRETGRTSVVADGVPTDGRQRLPA